MTIWPHASTGLELKHSKNPFKFWEYSYNFIYGPKIIFFSIMAPRKNFSFHLKPHEPWTQSNKRSWRVNTCLISMTNTTIIAASLLLFFSGCRAATTIPRDLGVSLFWSCLVIFLYSQNDTLASMNEWKYYKYFLSPLLHEKGKRRLRSWPLKSKCRATLLEFQKLWRNKETSWSPNGLQNGFEPRGDPHLMPRLQNQASYHEMGWRK